ncbi:hypothetical protein RND81_08G062900 [Saponaria officinalis]|uniref:F-box domain-containing protein n=1 Tax=Saponaria officinalis TaxID=3572 RepID=A0AAW1J3Y2_SAPOF
MANLPLDLILEEILPKLPAKSLLRFKCVSKIFKTLISSSNFINHHLRHSLSSVKNRLLIVNRGVEHGGFLSFDLDSPQIPPSPLLLPNDFIPFPRKCIVASCDGLLIIKGTKYGTNLARLVVVNPFTGFYRIILPNSYFNYGFGYDPHTDDYKFLEIDTVHIRIYSLMNNSSNFIANSSDNVIENFTGHRKFAIVVNRHLCHWLYWCHLQEKHRIVCFDLCTENWAKDVPLPNYNGNGSGLEPGSSLHFADRLFETCRNKKFDVINLTVFEGCLSVLTRNMSCDGNFDVWIMKDYGVAESWVKLFSVPDELSVPLCYSTRSTSKVLVWKMKDRNKGQLIWYNVRDRKSKKVEIRDVHGIRSSYNAYVFKGSLVTVPGGQQIRRNELH